MVPSEPVSQSPTLQLPTHLLTYSLCSPLMADKFDPYREALIVEVETQWPEEYDDWEPGERARVERLLHQAPEQAIAIGIRPNAHGFLPANRRDAGGYRPRDGVREVES